MPVLNGSRRVRARTLPLEIVDDHLLVHVGDARALVDTGSPLTFQAPSIVSQQLRREVRWLVGTDVLRHNRVMIDWRGGRVVCNGLLPRGEKIDLVPVAGLFQIHMRGPQGASMAWLDSGAAVSYAPASAVNGLVPVGQRSDFHPLVGQFAVTLYDLTVQVASRNIRARFGVLPPEVRSALALAGATEWILGADFFRDRVTVLDLGHSCVYDVRLESAQPRTTRDARRPVARVTTRDTVPVESRATTGVRQVDRALEGWRAWRLARMNDGTPRLLSLVAKELWDTPVYVSDRVPSLIGSNAAHGVHAFATPGGLANTLLHGPAIVYGQVTLYGRTCVHETGYRAERARIDRLYLRACGLHGRSAHDSIGARLTGAYCGCPGLSTDDWLSYDALESLAAALGNLYQCDVTVDALRARTSSWQCSATRLFKADLGGIH